MSNLTRRKVLKGATIIMGTAALLPATTFSTPVLASPSGEEFSIPRIGIGTCADPKAGHKMTSLSALFADNSEIEIDGNIPDSLVKAFDDFADNTTLSDKELKAAVIASVKQAELPYTLTLNAI